MNALRVAAAIAAAVLAYLLFWPDGMAPVAWTPLPAPDRDGGMYAGNAILKNIVPIAAGVGTGPETVNVDAVGRLYAGYVDGRIVQLVPDASTWTEMADTGGRPLGITFGPDGGLVIADAEKGLLALGAKVSPLVAADGVVLNFANDVDNTRLDKNVYFTDSSVKFRSATKDLLEHGANGRLLRYNVRTRETNVLLGGLHFANGVAVGPDDAYVLVCETGEYRVLRYWLTGEKAGTHDVFIDNLPGLPDNISFNNRDRFWLALAAPRSELLDRLLPGSFLARKILGRLGPLPRMLVRREAFVLGIGLDGKVVANLQYRGADAYAPITSVREFGPWLYFGSSRFPAIGRLPLANAVAGARPAPPGWQTAPPAREVELPRNRESEEEEERERRGAVNRP